MISHSSGMMIGNWPLLIYCSFPRKLFALLFKISAVIHIFSYRLLYVCLSTFRKTKLEVLKEVLKIYLIAQVKTSWVKFIDAYVESQNQSPQTASDSIVACEVLIVIEVVY